jgi:hypothetical protein
MSPLVVGQRIKLQCPLTECFGSRHRAMLPSKISHHSYPYLFPHTVARHSSPATVGVPPLPLDPSALCAIIKCLSSSPPSSPPDLGAVHRGEDGSEVDEVPFCSMTYVEGR